MGEPGFVKATHGSNQVFRLVQGNPPEIELLIELDQNGMLAHDERALLVSAPPIDAAPPVSLGVTDFLESKVVQNLSTPRPQPRGSHKIGTTNLDRKQQPGLKRCSTRGDRGFQTIRTADVGAQAHRRHDRSWEDHGSRRTERGGQVHVDEDLGLI